MTAHQILRAFATPGFSPPSFSCSYNSQSESHSWIFPPPILPHQVFDIPAEADGSAIPQQAARRKFHTAANALKWLEALISPTGTALITAHQISHSFEVLSAAHTYAMPRPWVSGVES